MPSGENGFSWEHADADQKIVDRLGSGSVDIIRRGSSGAFLSRLGRLHLFTRLGGRRICVFRRDWRREDHCASGLRLVRIR